jgi:asparagine synthase (glutamine-hydrolysing)
MTPPSKEAYYYRMIFESHFPSMSAVCTVPQVKSIACSTEKAIEWDETFKKNADESGRAVLGIHNSDKIIHTKVQTEEDVKSDQ